jgi:hypothetical protein
LLIGLRVTPLPPTGAAAWPGRTISVPLSATSPLGRIAETPIVASPLSRPPIEAGFHQIDAEPVSAASPEKARPAPRADCSWR